MTGVRTIRLSSVVTTTSNLTRRCYGLMSITFILAVYSTAMGHLLVVLRVVVLWDRHRASTSQFCCEPLSIDLITQKIMNTLIVSFAITLLTELILVIVTVATSEKILSRTLEFSLIRPYFPAKSEWSASLGKCTSTKGSPVLLAVWAAPVRTE